MPRLEAHVWVATSGTSSDAPGRVRWVALSKQAFLASAGAVNAHLAATASDVWAHALPLFHVGGLGILARAHLSGARVVAAVRGRWEPSAFRDAAEGAGATLAALVPSQVHDLVQARLDSPSSLRAVVVGGARLEPSLYRAARERGWPCLPSYGLTETCSQVATASLESLSARDCPASVPFSATRRCALEATGGCRFAQHRCSPATQKSTIVGRGHGTPSATAGSRPKTWGALRVAWWRCWAARPTR